MKKIKSIILATVLGLSAVCLTAQNSIRNYVGVVREQFYPNMIKFFEEYRDELKANGYSTYSKYVDSYLQGTFGSGFIYVAADGTNYVITNRHVVSQAATASIEFENPETGSIEKYENLKIFATDDDIDIAILKFADGKNPFKKGLTFASARVSDGADVWSAGFPGLGNNPLWQLGKGTVTNSSARIKELLDPSISTLIQHSAEVDGGNSGGPLMISSSKGTAGYEVVGVNTWKANYRQNTNFAIPSKVISDFISKAKVSVNSEEIAKERAKKFASALNDKNENFSSIAKFISYESAANSGKRNFEAAMRYAPSDARRIIADAFSYSPIEGLKYASAYQIWQKYSVKETEGTAFSVDSVTKNAESYSVKLKNDANDKTLNVVLKNEHGLWRVESVVADGETEFTNDKKSSKSSKSSKKVNSEYLLDTNSTFDLSGGLLKGLSGEKMGFFVAFDYWSFADEYVSFHIDFKHQSYKEDVFLNNVNMGFGFRLPFNVSQYICLQPVATLSVGMGGIDSRVMLGAGAEIGAEIILTNDLDAKPALGIAFDISKQTEFMDSSLDSYEDDKFDATFKNLKIYAKILFQ